MLLLNLGGVMKSHAIKLLFIMLIPVAFFLPNIYKGGVMLPLDLLHHLQPFANSVPPALKNVHNSSLSDLVTLYYPSIDFARTSSNFVPLWNPYSFFGAPLLANAQGGWLILSDLFYPGGEATCDGYQTEIFPANYLFRAVRIPAGTHIVEYSYRPASFRIGCRLMVLAGIMVVCFLCLGRKWSRIS
jgi:hypothetical protein